jgi:Ca2+-binding RTX toxin-like protein
VLLGGPGRDALAGFGGADALDGQDGDDSLDGGPGADVLAGSAGRDTLTYDQALQGVQVSLDGLANDGSPGEGDNAAGDIEVLIGSQSDDTLLAGAAALELHGSGGNDRLVGSGQGELLDGGRG